MLSSNTESDFEVQTTVGDNFKVTMSSDNEVLGNERHILRRFELG